MASKGRLSPAELRVVSPAPAASRHSPPPSHLSPAMSKWWQSVMADYELGEHHLRLLEAACGAWDRMVEARAAIDEHGLTFADRNGEPRIRPEVAIERDAR